MEMETSMSDGGNSLSKSYYTHTLYPQNKNNNSAANEEMYKKLSEIEEEFQMILKENERKLKEKEEKFREELMQMERQAAI